MARKETIEWFFGATADWEILTTELESSTPRVARGAHWQPRVDIIEEESQIIVRAELAGVRLESFSVAYFSNRHSLMIRGTRTDSLLNHSKSVAHQLEIIYGPFVREVELPAVAVDHEKISATFQNGLLLIRLPKI